MKNQELKKLKKEFVENNIKEGNCIKLSKLIAKGNVYRIPGYSDLDEGLEHGFLYLKSGSEINKHLNLNNVQLYRLITGDNKFEDRICYLGQYYGIESVECDTILEYFEVNRMIYSHIYNNMMLNSLLKEMLVNEYDKLNQTIYENQIPKVKKLN